MPLRGLDDQTSTQSIVSLVGRFTQDELVEDRGDVVANTLLHWAQTFSLQTQPFYAFYLLSHGVVKLGLVTGLLMRKLWAYPASLVVMTLFIAYQVYRYTYTPGIGQIS